MTDFNFIYHRRQTHTGVINGALWGAHDRRIREQRRSRILTTTPSIADARRTA